MVHTAGACVPAYLLLFGLALDGEELVLRGLVQALHVAQAGSGLKQCIGQALLPLLHLLHQLGICLSSSIAHCLLQLFFLHRKDM